MKKPLTRIVGGKGTFADPHRVKNDLADAIFRITQQGYDYEMATIQQARKLMEETELTPEQRARYEQQLLEKEFISRGKRAHYLTARAKAILSNPQKAERFRQGAVKAYQSFMEFADQHPKLSERLRHNEVWKSIFEPPEAKA